MTQTTPRVDTPESDAEATSTPVAEPVPAEPIEGRFRWTRVLGVCLLGFAIWLVLDAPTLQHNAQVSPVGTRRTVALDLLGPIADLSRDLGVSHLVSVTNGILGRNGNQPGNGSQVVTVLPKIHHVAKTKGHHHTPPVSGGGDQPVFPTAADPLRVLVIGDSLGLDVGGALVNDLASTGVVAAKLDGKEATGLTRPDYYSWPSELATDLTQGNPQVIVIMMGANDPQDFPGPPDIPYGTSTWNNEYAARVQSFMREATSEGAKVVWIGMPPMADAALSGEMAHIDSIDQAEALRTPGVKYLSTWTLLGTSAGAYTAYLTENGQAVNVREPDGTHISPGGGEIVSQAVISDFHTWLHIVLPSGS
jgi:lysophospholipase L1-like esterase